jgi:hypothetical protein
VFSAIDLVPKPRAAPIIPIRDRSDQWFWQQPWPDTLTFSLRAADLLSVADSAPLPVLSPRDFWELLRNAETNDSSKGVAATSG